MDLPPCSSTVTSCFIYFPFAMLPVIVQAQRSLEGPDSCNSGTAIVARVHVPAAAGWGGWNSGQPRVAETEAADALSRPVFHLFSFCNASRNRPGSALPRGAGFLQLGPGNRGASPCSGGCGMGRMEQDLAPR